MSDVKITKPKPEPDKTLRWWTIAFVVALLLLGVYGIYLMALRSAVQSRLDAITAAGDPATLEELDASYPAVLNHENAALIYLEAASLAVEDDALEKQIPQFSTRQFSNEAKMPDDDTQPLPPKMLEAMRAYLTLNDAALRRAHEAAKLSRSRYPVDLTKGWDIMLTHLHPLRHLVRLLSIELELHVEAGDTAGATRSILTMIASAESLRDEPLLVSQSMRVAFRAMFHHDIKRALARISFTTEELATIQTALISMDDPNNVHRAIAGGRCMTADFFQRSVGRVDRDDMLPYDLFGLFGFVYVALGVRDLDHMAYLDYMERAIAILDGPTDKVIADLKILEDELDDEPMYHPLTRKLAGVFSIRITWIWKYRSMTRSQWTVLAIERFRLDHQRLPTDLTELVPDYLDAIPQDPFDGKPLKFTTLSPGYIVYSVGRDQVDDGGKTNEQDTPDVAFTVKR